MSDLREYKKKIKELKSPDKKQKSNDIGIEIRHLKALIEIARDIVKNLNLQEVLKSVLENAIVLTHADRGFIILCDEKGRWNYRLGIDADFSPLPIESFQMSTSVVNKVAEEKKSIFIEDVIKEKEFKEKKSIKELGLKMILAAPLEKNENLVGVLYVDSITPAKAFTQREKYLFEIYARFASIAITNAQLYEFSITDPLTDLPNLQYFYRRLDEEITHVRRHGGNISLLMLDIDNFKSINYTYGYLFGNRLLKTLGQLLWDNVGETYFASRFGEDKFVILLPQTGAKEARKLAKKLIEKVKSSLKYIGNEEVNLSISIGIVSFPGAKISSKEELIVEVENALNLSKRQGGGVFTTIDYHDTKVLPAEVVGVSSFYKELSRIIKDISQSKIPCLILGETGVGKELIARCIHKLSKRRNAPFIVMDCVAVPDTLFEDELFGHNKGAYTGAISSKKGKFELANGGTLFLDEIGDLPLFLQSKLLRVIETNTVQRIGGEKSIPIDVRIISATNKNLEGMVKSGTFRKDLFYRLNAFTIKVPPLRERKEDILPIAEYYLKHFARAYKKSFRGFSSEAKKSLLSHPWFGNVRELKHVIEKAVIISRGNEITKEDLNLQLNIDGYQRLKEAVEEKERTEIERVFRMFEGNISRTAKALGISRQTLRKKLRRYGIDLR